MNICLISPNLNQGGNERDIVVIANLLHNHQCAAHVYLFRKEGVLLEKLSPAVSISSIGPFRMRYAIWRFTCDMIQLENQVVVVMCFDTACIIGILKILGVLKCPVVYRESSQPVKYAGAFFSKLYSLVFNKFDLIVAQTNAAREQLHRLGVQQGKIKVMHNPLELTRKTPSINKSACLKLLCVGRAEQVKGFDRMIDAVVQIRHAGLNVQLKIIGGGSLHGCLLQRVRELKAEDFIHLPGHQVNPFAVVDGDEIFVLSSYYEGQPNVLMEALATGLRCVVSAAGGGAQEMMQNVGLGAFVIDDSEDFKSALHEKLLLASRLSATDMSRAQDLFFHQYDVSHVRDFYLAELSRLYDGR